MAPRIRANIIANYIGSAWTAIIGIVLIPTYIGYLGMESYGLIAIFATLQIWLSLIDTGLAPTLSREMARFRGGEHTIDSIRDLLRSLEFVYLALALICAVCIYLVAPWIGVNWLNVETLPIDVVSQALALMGVLIGLRWVAGLYRSALVGLQEQIWLNVVLVFTSTFRAVGSVVVLAMVSPTIQAFFIFNGIAGALECALLAALAYATLPRASRRAKFNLDALKAVWKFAGGMMVITLLSLMLTQVDKLLLARLIPLTEFAHYALAGVLAGGLYYLSAPIAGALGPRIAELVARGDDAGLRSAYHFGCQLVTIAVAPAAVVLACYSEAVLLLWTGDGELASQIHLVLTGLVIGTMFNTFMQIPYALTLGYGWTRFAITMNICAVTVLVPAIFVVVPTYGAVGAATVWLVLNFTYVVIAIPFLHRELFRSEMRTWYLNDVVGPLLAVSGSVGVLRLLAPPRADASPLENIVLLLLAFAVAQAVVLVATKTGRGVIRTIGSVIIRVTSVARG